MRIIRTSTLMEYAEHFQKRQARKNGTVPRGNPMAFIGQFPYKLPYESEYDLQIAELSQEDVEELRIYDRMLNDDWMKSRNPHPPTNRLKDLAAYFIAEHYFTRQADSEASDGQTISYRRWKAIGSLEGALTDNMPLIQENTQGQYEIVDGWGRLLAYLVLVQEGLPFCPIMCFVAHKRAVR